MAPFLGKGEPLDSLVFIILVDPNVPQCNEDG